MSTDYNQIAKQYVEAKQDPWRYMIEEPSFIGQIGDVTGLKVVDLACGSGHYTRKVMARGPASMLGVDISEEQIKLARAEEQRQPLGIDYQVADATAEGPQLDYDLAMSAYLLPYTRTIDELDAYCRGIARHVKPGGRFVTITTNNNIYHYPQDVYAEYGSKIELEDEAQIGAKIVFVFPSSDGEFRIENYYIPNEEYRAALERAGFKDVQLINPIIDESRLGEFAPGYWDTLLKHPLALVIDAVRA
ncbi:class I SAM-dependent methyltransferase [Cerasicoccus fimbriatus]|uniref:class I SAM-dependent methyltransferase n=1 Tax=Cerasicoccus fimbriatus TaxID=3014554 RepID=UPI0022B32DF8|nr:class I SAM-dependent methyltransferase [Cerasicoccus sp. TK19100]